MDLASAAGSSLAGISLPSTMNVSWSTAPSYGSGKTNATSICRLPVFTNDCETWTRATWSTIRAWRASSLILYDAGGSGGGTGGRGGRGGIQ